MKQIKDILLKLAATAVFSVAITTVASTSRVFAYQPELDGEVMKKYLKESR